MQGVRLNFNAATVEPNKAFDPIPSGWVNAMIVNSEMQDTSKPGGKMLSLELQVIDGPYAGRKLFDRLNLVNENPVAVDIAFKTLSAICHATGVIQCETSLELHNKPMKVKVKLKPATADYEAGNEIKAYDNVNSDHAVLAPIVGGVVGAPAGVPNWAAGQAGNVPNNGAAASPFPAFGGVPSPAPAGFPGAAAAPFPTPAVAPPVAPFQTPAAAQPWPNPAAAAPTPPTPFAAPGMPAPAPVPVAAAPVRVMTDKAQGAAYEAWIANGWNDQALLDQGYMVYQNATPAPAFAMPPASTGPVAPWAMKQ